MDAAVTELPSLGEFAARSRYSFEAAVPGALGRRAVVEVNEFFARRGCGAARRGRSASTRASWRPGWGSLDAVGCSWRDGGAREVDEFKFWRMSDEENPRRVAGGTLRAGLVAIASFYGWAHLRYGVASPVTRIEGRRRRFGWGGRGYRARPHCVRDRDVKWLDPGGYRRWRDVGLRGLDVDGREADVWRGRNSQRDCVFADGLVRDGFAAERVGERAADRTSDTIRRAVHHRAPRGGVREGWPGSHATGSGRGARRRTRPMSRGNGPHGAPRPGRRPLRQVTDRLVLRRVLGGRRIEVADASGERSTVSLDVLTPQARGRLFPRRGGWRAGAGGGVAERGRDAARAARLAAHLHHGEPQSGASRAAGLAATAHMLRHSFALRWFAVGRLLYERRFAHLSAEEMRDYRAQFGDTWYFVMTLLGHRDVAAHDEHLSRPFRDLEVSLLIEHAHGAVIDGLLAEMFAAHPLVQTDPVPPP